MGLCKTVCVSVSIVKFSELLGNSNFKKFVAARFLSNVGNGMTAVAMSFGVLSIEGATKTNLSLAMACLWVPMVALMLIGGVFADRVRRNLLVGRTDLLAGVVAAGMAVNFFGGDASIVVVYVLNFLFGILVALWVPAFLGLLPLIVNENELQSANSIMGMMTNFGFLIGAFAGGSIVAGAGPGWAFAVDAGSFVIAGLLVLNLKIDDVPRGPNQRAPSLIHELREGWTELLVRKWVWAIILGASILNMSWETVLAVLGPLQFSEQYGGARQWGILIGFESFGMLVGVLIAIRIRPRHPMRLAMCALLLPSLLTIGIGVQLRLWILAILAVGAGIGIDIFGVIWLTSIQRSVPSDSLSRVMSYDAFGSNIFVALGLVTAGPLAQWIGTGRSLIAIGLVSISAILATLSVREVREMRGDISA